MVSVGVMGCGYWGSNLIRNLHELDGADLRYCCDLDEKQLKRFSHFSSEVCLTQDYNKPLADPDLQAIVLATPADTHYSLAKEVLLAGKDVLVEKPMVLRSHEAEELIELAEKLGRIIMVGHVFLYNPAVVKLKEYVKQEKVGKVYYLYSARVNLGRVRTDVSAMWNLAPHDISIMCYLLDAEPIAVGAQGAAYLQPGIEDTVFLTLVFPGGQLGQIHVSWLDPSKKRTMTIVGSEKMIIYDDVDNEAKLKVYDKGITMQDAYYSFGEFQFKLRSGDVFIPKLNLKEPLKIECSHFIDCIKTRKSPLTDGRNGLGVIRVLEAAQASLSKQGQLVEVRH